VLTLTNIHAAYNGSEALRGIDVTVPAGSLTAVIGPNGAGKTTLLRMISGFVTRTQGSAIFEGTDLKKLGPDEIVRRGVIHVPEGRMVFGRMSVKENLLIGAYTRSDASGIAADFDYVLTLFPLLQERMSQLAGSLSGGEQQMLAIGRGLMARPRLLMLDEPSLGLAPLIITKIFDVLREIKARGVTVLLVEQNAEKALSAADLGYVLDLGRVAAHGASRDLLNDERVRRAYLGA
jgi:branched-chain amino acid transport system ATP-binding protein